MNPDEVFTCKDLMNGKCNTRVFFDIGNKCYFYEEEEFVSLLLDKLEKRRKYADFLEKEGSVLAAKMRERDTMFRLRNENAESDE